jgi:hypothetical protein
MAQVVEHLTSKGEALNSNPTSVKERERERKEGRKEGRKEQRKKGRKI